MKKLFAGMFLLICFLPFAYGQRIRFGQEPPKAKPGIIYPIKVHISGIYLRRYYIGSGQNEEVLYADAIMNGKKFELMGDWIWFRKYYRLSPSPGDYQARLLKDAPAGSPTPIYQKYELLMPENTIWRCTVTGFSE